jgi:high-affinity Fe2+/Pb2+ permease
MKKVLYYVIFAAIFIAFVFTFSIVCSLAEFNPGRIHMYAFIILAFVITGWLSRYVKKWLGIKEKQEENSK